MTTTATPNGLDRLALVQAVQLRYGDLATISYDQLIDVLVDIRPEPSMADLCWLGRYFNITEPFQTVDNRDKTPNPL